MPLPNDSIDDVIVAKCSAKYDVGNAHNVDDYLVAWWWPDKGNGQDILKDMDALDVWVTSWLTTNSLSTAGWPFERWRRYWDNVTL